MSRIAVLIFALLFQEFAHGARGSEALLVPGKNWELLGEGYQLTADSAVDHAGNIFFTDARNNRIYKVDSGGHIALWKEESGGAHGIAYGPDGLLYAGQHNQKRIVALSADRTESVLAEDVQTHHLTVTDRNQIYFADAPNHRVWLLDAAGMKRVVTEQVDWPHCLRLSSDRTRLLVTDPHTAQVMRFPIQPDGGLARGEPFCRLKTRTGTTATEAGGMAFDSGGYFYVATNLGVQVFDATGHSVTTLDPPGKGEVSDVFFAGDHMQWLVVTDGEKLYRRAVRRHGAARN